MIAGAWNMTIFEVLKQDIDTFILISNYLIELGDKEHSKPISKNQTKANNERIRVNDSTATGGWF